MSEGINNLIRKWDDPILKRFCAPVEPGEPLPFLDLMIRVCRHKSRGVGLAAPQIGHAKRVFVTLVGHPKTFINPVVEWMSPETDVKPESCLSFPGIEKWIRRSKSLRLSYLDGRRKPRSETFDGFIARVIQHEVDHLKGICQVGDEHFLGETPECVASSSQGADPVLAAMLACGLGGRR